MSDPSDGSIDYKREQRLAALEEKRKKLAEAKAKNASLSRTPSNVPGTPPSTPVKHLESVGSSWNDIVATIESIPVSATSTPVKQASNDATQVAAPAVKKSEKPLTLSLGFATIDIPPKREVQMYSRGTQTEFSASKKSNKSEQAEDNLNGTESNQNRSENHLVSTTSDVVEMVVSEPQEYNNDQDEAFNSTKEQKKPVTVMKEEESKATIKSEDFLKFVSQSSAIMDRALLLSEKYDLLDGRYDTLDVAPKLSQKVASHNVGHILTLFDKEYSIDQQFNDIDWNPFEKGKVMSATYDRNGGSGSAILEFNLDYDGRLENRLLHASSRITAAKYWTSPDNTYNTSAGGGRLIIGGSYTGQIVLWDTRSSSSRAPILTVSNSSTNSSSAVGTSPHKHPIYSLHVIDNRHFASVDTLGTLAVWDIYKMSHPIEELSLTWIKTGMPFDSSVKIDSSKTEGGPSNEVSVTGITFRDENAFYVASEDGSLYSGQRHGDRKGLLQHYRGHQATLSSVRVHPLNTSLPPDVLSQNLSSPSSPSLLKYNFNDLVLTSSLDWSVCLWHPKLTSKPIAVFSDFSDYVMDVAWSNHHPAIFAAADSAGVLSIWNLNSDEKEVALLTNNQSSPHALNKVIWSPHQPDLLVAASHTSHVHVYKVDSDVVTPSGEEWVKLEHTIDEYHEQLIQEEREEASIDPQFSQSLFTSNKD